MWKSKATWSGFVVALTVIFVCTRSFGADTANENARSGKNNQTPPPEPTTEWKYRYYEDGQLHERAEFYINAKEKMVRHGKREIYAPDGRLTWEESWRHGKMHGPWITYGEKGRKDMEWNYANGALEGVSRNWWKNGTLRSEKEFRKDVQHGAHMTYYDNGLIEERGQYHNGRRIGKWERYARAGERIALETFDEEGKPTGIHEFRHHAGKLLLRVDYTAKDGLVAKEAWHPNGTKWYEGKAYDGFRKHGTWTYWNAKGEMVAEGEWKDGQPWSGVCSFAPANWMEWLLGPSDDFFRMKDGKRLDKVDVRFNPD